MDCLFKANSSPVSARVSPGQVVTTSTMTQHDLTITIFLCFPTYLNSLCIFSPPPPFWGWAPHWPTRNK